MELHRLLEDLVSDGRISKYATSVPVKATGLLDGLFKSNGDEEVFSEVVTTFRICKSCFGTKV